MLANLCCNVSPKVRRPVICRASLKILNILIIRNIWAILRISDWYFVSSSFSVPVSVTKEMRSDMKYGRIPNRSMIFITPFTNLQWKTEGRTKSARLTYKNLCGAAINLMTYSKENHPTKTASASSKKSSSPETSKINMNGLRLWYRDISSRASCPMRQL